MTRPQLYISDFSDERGRASYYIDRIRQLDIPKPFEVLIPLTDSPNMDEEVSKIKEAMHEHSMRRAFVKTDYKAAVSDLKRGSFILDNTEAQIRSTVESLIAQNTAHDWPNGNHLVLREWLDLNFCMQLSHSCHPEVRYFIEDGEIIGRTPTEYDGRNHTCSQQYKYLDETLQDSSPPDALAERVADEFNEASWGVDFALDTDGNWYFIEMNFNGIYWNDELERWWDMTGQGDNAPFGPYWTHGAALPDLTNYPQQEQ